MNGADVARGDAPSRCNAKKVIMFSLFRRLGNRAPSFSWMPAVDVTNPRVTAMLLGLGGR